MISNGKRDGRYRILLGGSGLTISSMDYTIGTFEIKIAKGVLFIEFFMAMFNTLSEEALFILL
ncbi:hypothetical protein BDF14DRAFT_1837783 [Spinellus fusiger]|nr:hypothetical protein BDF14DRAFT_1837783 [Spinellus fusiger]